MRWQASQKRRAAARGRALWVRTGLLPPWLRLPVLVPVTAVLAALTFPLLYASLAGARQLSDPAAATAGPAADEEGAQGLAMANASLASLSSNASRFSGVAD